MSLDKLKTVPFSNEAEKSVLGGILLKQDVLEDIIEIVKINDFYKLAHQYIYEVMLECYNQGLGIDPIVITDKLKRKNKYEDIGGDEILFDIIESVPTAANVTNYARIVKEKSVLRGLINVGSQIVELANAKKGTGKKPAPKAKPIRKMAPVEITDTPLYEDEPLVTDDRELVFDFGPMPEFDETTARAQLENAAARDHWYKMQKLNRGADLQYFDDMKKYRDMVDGFENELKSTKDKRPTGLDVANLKMALAYGDQISGTDLARHYTPPTALKDWQDRVDSLEQIIAAKRGEIPQETRQYIDMRENNKIAREGQEGMNIRQQREFDHQNQLFDKDAALKMWLAKNKPPSFNPFSQMNYDLRAREALDNRVKDLSKDTRDVSDSLKSINGAIGMMDHFLKNNIPLTKAGNSGLGRFLSGSEGDGKALMLTPEGIELNSRIVDIVARYNKMISGAAVTDAEARRLLQVVAAGRFNDFNDMRKGLTYLQRKVKEEWKNIESGYRPEIISEYKRRGGSSYRDFNDNSSPLFTENDEVKKPQNPKDYKIGQVVRGHVFKGGDATNKNNWEKVK